MIAFFFVASNAGSRDSEINFWALALHLLSVCEGNAHLLFHSIVNISLGVKKLHLGNETDTVKA